MAADAIIRYRVIDTCLRDRSTKWRWQELAEACYKAYVREGIEKEMPSRRTILGDIKSMKTDPKLGYNAPIAWSRSDGYRYDDPSYSINQLPLKEYDRKDFEGALLVLRQYSERSGLQGIKDSITRLSHTLNMQEEAAESPLILFEHSLNEAGQQWLDNIYESIRDRACIKIYYQPFKYDSPQWRIVSPHLLKEYNNRWFLFALDHALDAMQTFGLDRIKQIDKSLQDYRRSPTFKASAYFKDIVGVTLNDGPKQRIVFETDTGQAKYIATKPLHESQRQIKETDDVVTFEMELIPNYELESLLLSFGERVRVLKPATLKKTLENRINAARINSNLFQK